MQTVVKAPTQADFLAMVPQLVGLDIHDSLVLVGFRGKRTHAAIRFGLPAVGASRDVLKKFSTTMVGTFCKIPELDGVVVVICTSENFGQSSTVPYAVLGKLLVDRLDRSGFELKDALCQARDGWASYFEIDVPRGGHSLDEIDSSPVFDAVPGGVLRQVRSRQGAPRVPDAPPHAQERMRAGLAELQRAVDAERASGVFDSRLDTIEDVPHFVESTLMWDDSDVEALGPLLVHLITSPSMRDHCMLQWASSERMGDLLFEWAMAGPVGSYPELDKHLGGLMMGDGPRPDPQRIETGIALLLKIVPLLVGADRLAPLCMLTWLNWALGRGSIAGIYLNEAMTIDNTYGMVEVLAMILQNGVLPEWAFYD